MLLAYVYVPMCHTSIRIYIHIHIHKAKRFV